MTRLEAKNREIAIIFFIVSSVVIPTSRAGAVIDLKHRRLKEQTGVLSSNDVGLWNFACLELRKHFRHQLASDLLRILKTMKSRVIPASHDKQVS